MADLERSIQKMPKGLLQGHLDGGLRQRIDLASHSVVWRAPERARDAAHRGQRYRRLLRLNSRTTSLQELDVYYDQNLNKRVKFSC